MARALAAGVALFTIGHSNRTAEAFRSILESHEIRGLVDVRRFPASRRHPHFARAALESLLARARIHYRHEPALGGHRDPRPGSPNTTWHEDAFRGYADHMASPEFGAALRALLEAARERPTAVMCAEADPLRCHRQLLADALVVAGAQVLHVVAPDERRPHVLHPAARVGEDGRLTYPAAVTQHRLFG